MAKGKIAPTLQHFISARTCHQGECGGDAECDRVEKELAALLAVARAAHRSWGMLPNDMMCDGRLNFLANALARLDRVSGGKP